MSAAAYETVSLPAVTYANDDATASRVDLGLRRFVATASETRRWENTFPRLPSGAGSDLFALPANEVWGSGDGFSHFHWLLRLPAPQNSATPGAADDPQDAL